MQFKYLSGKGHIYPCSWVLTTCMKSSSWSSNAWALQPTEGTAAAAGARGVAPSQPVTKQLPS